jgi:hypothetical protein
VSTMTHTGLAGGFDDWDDLAALAVLADSHDREEMVGDGPRRTHRPHRSAADRAAIEQSQRDAS